VLISSCAYAAVACTVEAVESLQVDPPDTNRAERLVTQIAASKGTSEEGNPNESAAATCVTSLLLSGRTKQ
jgi:hypothetical protein